MVLATLAALCIGPGAAASAVPLATVKVPSQYATIQAAINAANPGDTILVGAGTFVEQLTIHKSLNIVGSGTGKTTLKSPTALAQDSFGNEWTVEIDGGATVTLSRITVLVTQHCILPSGLPADPTAHPHVEVYAGGGIGVGGSATLSLKSAVVTTGGAKEGAACGVGGFKSYGTGVDFGLDYQKGSPTTSQLVGGGTIYGSTISGFGFGGPDVSVGGQANSPAGSSAGIANNQITTSADELPPNVAPAVSVGFGGNASSAKIGGNVISTLPSIATNVISVFSGSSASIALNSILVGPQNDAIVILSSTANITLNSIQGSTTDFSGGIILYLSTATITFNSLANFECEFNATVVGLGLCGPSFLSQAQVLGIADIGDAGAGTLIEYNLVSNADAGIMMSDAGIFFGSGSFVGTCSNCVIKNNLLNNSIDYALVGVDGNYTFSHDVTLGGLYGAAALAVASNTTVTLSHVTILHPSGAPHYLENDCLIVFGYACTVAVV